MKKIITLILFSMLTLNAGVDMPKDDLNEADVKRTKNFYKKYLQKACHNTAANFAQMHTQEEWKSMKKNKVFILEVVKLCPKANNMITQILIKDNGKKAFDDLARFSIQYAKGTGKFPPC
jgi:type III secretory pathway component EscR